MFASTPNQPAEVSIAPAGLLTGRDHVPRRHRGTRVRSQIRIGFVSRTQRVAFRRAVGRIIATLRVAILTACRPLGYVEGRITYDVAGAPVRREEIPDLEKAAVTGSTMSAPDTGVWPCRMAASGIVPAPQHGPWMSPLNSSSWNRHSLHHDGSWHQSADSRSSLTRSPWGGPQASSNQDDTAPAGSGTTPEATKVHTVMTQTALEEHCSKLQPDLRSARLAICSDVSARCRMPAGAWHVRS